ncbi:hypothetical protein EGJ53_04860 [Pseudomonas fluorescens]|nr:hypothetical protein EGJ53_04860 [Pseudomonas fluorescens]
MGRESLLSKVLEQGILVSTAVLFGGQYPGIALANPTKRRTTQMECGADAAAYAMLNAEDTDFFLTTGMAEIRLAVIEAVSEALACRPDELVLVGANMASRASQMLFRL